MVLYFCFMSVYSFLKVVLLSTSDVGLLRPMYFYVFEYIRELGRVLWWTVCVVSSLPWRMPVFSSPFTLIAYQY